MTAYRRYRLKGGCYFFTVALAERGGSLLTENIGGLRVAFRKMGNGVRVDLFQRANEGTPA